MNYSINDYFKLFPSCILVKGYIKSVIIDTDIKKVFHISNEHFSLIKELNEKTISEIIKEYNYEKIDDFLKYLINNNFGFIIKKEEKDNFLPIEDVDSIPFQSNSIVDIDNFDFNKIKLTIKKLNEANIANIQFRILKSINFEEFSSIIRLVESFSFYSVEFLINYMFYSTLSKGNLSYINKCQIISKIFVFDSEYNQLRKESKFLFLNNPLNNDNLCGHTSVNYFSCFLETVLYSKKYNTCLNCKISVDKYGKVKKCPSMKESFGDIEDVSIKEILKKSNFKKFDKITKDDIHVCKDCEFRYICTDCRAYIDDPNDIYSRPSKCTYNPYIAKWKEEEGYRTLEECGVICNEQGFSIDHEKIAQINKELWGE